MSQDPSLEPADHDVEDLVEDGPPDSSELAATGDERVDAALAGLRALADLPVAEHPQVYDRLHAELRAVLDHADGTVHRDGPDDEPA